MSTAARMQPDPNQKPRIDIPNWLLAVVAVLTIVFAAGALSQRVSALENDHVGKAEVQSVQRAVDGIQQDVRELNRNVMKALEKKQ